MAAFVVGVVVLAGGWQCWHPPNTSAREFAGVISPEQVEWLHYRGDGDARTDNPKLIRRVLEAMKTLDMRIPGKGCTRTTWLD